MKKIMKSGLVFLLLAGLILSAAIAFRAYKHTKSVTQYRQAVEEVAQKKNIEEYTDVILGIMLTESKGKGVDLMQSSESVYGSRGKIQSQQESIENGVNHFAQSYEQAMKAGCDLNTAIQAYNFGPGYIQYVKKHGEKSTLALAEAYSRDVLSPSYGNNDHQMYRYMKIQSFFYNGGYLYQNGGNMFYAQIVQMNRRIIDVFDRV